MTRTPCLGPDGVDAAILSDPERAARRVIGPLIEVVSFRPET
jgi:hypothetical protein